MADTLALRCANAVVAQLRAAVTLVDQARIRLDPVEYVMPFEALPAITVRLGTDEPELDLVARLEERVGIEVRIHASDADGPLIPAAEAIRAQAYAALMAAPTLGGAAGALDYAGTVRDYADDGRSMAAVLSFSARIERARADLTQ